MVFQVARQEIPEAVAHGYRRTDLLRADADAHPSCIEPGFGGIERPIGAGHLESHDVRPGTEAFAGIPEGNFDGIALHLHTFVGRRVGHDSFITIRLVEGLVREAFAHLPLVGGVNLRCFVGLHEVVGANHRAVRYQRLGIELGLAEESAVHAVGIPVVCKGRDFHEIERQVGVVPELPPVLDHRRQPFGIRIRVPDVATALIPSESSDGVAVRGVEQSVVHNHRLEVLGPFLAPGLAQVFVGIGLEDFLREPAFHARAAPGATDYPHGNLQGTLEREGVVVGRCAKPLRVVGRRQFPLSPGVFLRSRGAPALNRRHADGGMVGRVGNEVVRVVDGTIPEAVQRHFHVRLSGAEPDLAHQHVVERPFPIVVGYRQRVGRETGRRRGDSRRPAAVAAGFCSKNLRRPRRTDADRAARFGLAPETGVGLLLYDHIVADQVGQFDFGVRREGRQQAGE